MDRCEYNRINEWMWQSVSCELNELNNFVSFVELPISFIISLVFAFISRFILYYRFFSEPRSFRLNLIAIRNNGSLANASQLSYWEAWHLVHVAYVPICCAYTNLGWKDEEEQKNWNGKSQSGHAYFTSVITSKLKYMSTNTIYIRTLVYVQCYVQCIK